MVKEIKTKIKRFLISYLTVSLVCDGFLFAVLPVQPAAAAVTDGMAAYDVLGQSDTTACPLGSAPSFTTSYTNNGFPNEYTVSGNGIVLDTVNHRLFIAHAASNRILVHDLDTNNDFIDKVADNVLGQPDFFSSASGLTQSALNNPQGLAYDPTGDRLFVGDWLNRRVM